MENRIRTLHPDYLECILDIEIFGRIVSAPHQSLEELTQTLYEEFKLSTPMPTLEAKRYELSRPVSNNYQVTYDGDPELQDNESLVDLQGSESRMPVVEFEDLGSLIPDVKEVFRYEERVTTSYRDMIVAKYDLDTGEDFKPGVRQTENIVGSTSEDASLTLSDDEIDSIGSPSEEETAVGDDEAPADSFDDLPDDVDFGTDDVEFGTIESPAIAESADVASSEPEYIDDEEEESESDESDFYLGDESDESEEPIEDGDDSDFDGEDSAGEDSDDGSDDESDEGSDDYYIGDEEESDEGSEDDFYLGDEDEEPEDGSEEPDDGSDDESDEGSEDGADEESDDDDFYLGDEDAEEGVVDDSDGDSDDSDFGDEESGEEPDEEVSDEESSDDVYFGDEGGSEESEGEDSDDDFYLGDESDEDPAEESSDEESEDGEDSADDFYLGDEDESGEDSDDESSEESEDSDDDFYLGDEDDSETDDTPASASVVPPPASASKQRAPEPDDFDVDDFMPEPTPPPRSTPQRPQPRPQQANPQSQTFKVPQPAQAFVPDRGSVPSDIRQFVRQHPRCEVQFALQYFTKKQIDDAVRLGRIIRKGNILR